MGAYVLRRLLIGLGIVWGVYTLTFLAVNLAPGDPFANLENPKMAKEDLDRLRAQWGYDKPVFFRYFHHLRKMFWADPEVLTTEGEGLVFEVAGSKEGNVVRAYRPDAPAVIRLVPLEESRNSGVVEVVLERDAAGAYPTKPIQAGRFTVGRTRLVASAESPSQTETHGVRVRVKDLQVSAEVVLKETPAEVTLTGEDGETLVLRPGAGPVRPPSAQRYRLGQTDVLVPPDPLESGGPTFDLGTSIRTKQPVRSYLAAPLLNTIILGLAAVVLDFILGVVIGVVAAVRRGTRLDGAITLGSLFVYSMPGFWLSLMLMLLFAVKLQWLPAEGMHDPEQTGFLDLLKHLVLPALVLGIGPAAHTARYQRSALLEVLGQDFVRTARAKGLSERTVIWKHAFRNSLLPVITLLGLSLPFLVSGAVITETIFSWPGIGRETIAAIGARDVFVLTGITLIATTMVVVGSILADVLYAVADPRVRLR